MLALNKNYIIILILAFIIYIVQGEIFFNFIFYLAILSLIISFAYTFVVSKFIYVITIIDKPETTVYEKVSCRKLIQNTSFLPIPFLEIVQDGKKQVVWLNPKAAVTISSDLKFNKRGIYEVGEASLEINDILFICKVKKVIKSNEKVKVYPKLHKIEEKDSFQSVLGNSPAGGSNIGDFSTTVDVRKYYYGDNLNKIHWKISAKLGELYTRNFESQNSENKILIIDMSENELKDEVNEESMISFSASLVNYFFENNTQINVYINNKEEKCFEIDNKEAFNNIMEYFITHKSLGKKSVSEFLRTKDEHSWFEKPIYILTVKLNSELEKQIAWLRANGKECKVLEFRE